MIPLSQLKTDPQAVISECCDTGRALVVELPDHHLVAIQRSEPDDADDLLVSDLIETDPAFRALVERSETAQRRPFPPHGEMIGGA